LPATRNRLPDPSGTSRQSGASPFRFSRRAWTSWTVTQFYKGMAQTKAVTPVAIILYSLYESATYRMAGDVARQFFLHSS
jgi:hypothetical protein